MSLFAPAPPPPTNLVATDYCLRMQEFASRPAAWCDEHRRQVGLGWHGFMTKEQSFKLLNAYFDAGYTAFYKRADPNVTIGVNYLGNNVKSMSVSLDDSLKKLRTTYIDIFYVHWWDYDTSIPELMNGLHNLVTQEREHPIPQHGSSPKQTNMLVIMERHHSRSTKVHGMSWTEALSATSSPWLETKALHWLLERLGGGKLRTDEEEKRSWNLEKRDEPSQALSGCEMRPKLRKPRALDITLSKEQIAYLESIVPVDPGFPNFLIGDGTTYGPMFSSAAYVEQRPLREPVKLPVANRGLASCRIGNSPYSSTNRLESPVLQYDQLVEIIRHAGRQLVEAQPKEHTVGNTVRKVLHHIREEYNTATHGGALAQPRSAFSIAKFLVQGQPRQQNVALKSSDNNKQPLKENDADDPDSFAKGLKPVLMEAIQDVLDELETVYDNRNYTHAWDVANSGSLSEVRRAPSKLYCHCGGDGPSSVYQCVGRISSHTLCRYRGHDMGKALSSSGISTFLVPDSSIFALMSRVNKVIIGAHAILANGGIFAVSGSLLAATAAREHSTPIVVCAGQFKFTPLWNLYHEYGALDFGDPNNVLGFEEGDLVDKVDVVNPYYDYVRPELIDVFITN
ncbi:GCD complex [Salix suchowensis]|nr:GCD complex [Salix suchowensis]